MLVTILLLLAPLQSNAQGGKFQTIVITTSGAAVAFPQITVCTGTQTTCLSGNANVYADLALTQQMQNPFFAPSTNGHAGSDGAGNVAFYATPGNYTIRVAPSSTSNLSFAAYLMYDVIVPPNLADSQTLTFWNSALLPHAASAQSIGSATLPWNIFLNNATIAGTISGNVIASGNVQGKVLDTGGAKFNVVAYGADPTGATSSNAGVSQAISVAGPSGPYFPCGHYVFTQNVVLTNANFIGEGAQGRNGVPCVLLEWTGGTIGIQELAGTLAGNDSTSMPNLRNFGVKNSTGNNSFIGIQAIDIPIYADNISMDATNTGFGQNMTCMQFIQDNGNGTERGAIGPGVWLNCPKDLDFLNSNPGVGSTGGFMYWRIMDPNLDSNSLFFENGAFCGGCDISFKFNSNGGTIITTTGAGGGISNSFFNIYGENTTGSCVPYNLGPGTAVQGWGMTRMACSGTPVLGAGAHWLVHEVINPDGYVTPNSDMGQYPGAGTQTGYLTSSQRPDLVVGAGKNLYSELFTVTNPGATWDAYGVTFSTTLHWFSNCWEIWNPTTAGVNPFSTLGNKAISLCGDGHTFMRPTVFATAPGCGPAGAGGGLEYVINDSPTHTGGAIISAGGGAFIVKMFCNGLNWIVETGY